MLSGREESYQYFLSPCCVHMRVFVLACTYAFFGRVCLSTLSSPDWSTAKKA